MAAALILCGAKTDDMKVVTGVKAFTNTASLSPGLARKITVQDLPQPHTPAILPRLKMYLGAGFPKSASRPGNAIPKAPAGFKVDLYVSGGLTNPRQIETFRSG